jgi:TonB family protein
MNNNNSSTGLFLTSGCISAEALKRYALGTLDAIELDLVQRHSADCQLCSEALRGLRNLNDRQNLENNLNSIEKHLRERIIKGQQTGLIVNRNNSRRIFRYASIAAGVLLIAGVFSIIYIFNKLNNNSLENNLSLSDSPKSFSNFDSSLTENAPVTKKDEARSVGGLNKESSKQAKESKEKGLEKMKTGAERHNLKISKRKEMPGPVADTIVQMDMEDASPEIITASQASSGIETRTAGESLSSPVITAYSVKSKKAPIESSRVSGLAVDQDKSLSEVIVVSKSMKISDASKSAANHEEQEVYNAISKMPAFNGKGKDEFEKYVSARIIYPKEAYKNKIEGIVHISFTVDSLGKVINVNSLQECNELLEKEAIRVVSSSPLWTPGNINGKQVNVALSIPVSFKIR